MTRFQAAPAIGLGMLTVAFDNGIPIGVAGFEPTASCTQSRRSAKLSYTPQIKANRIVITPECTRLAGAVLFTDALYSRWHGHVLPTAHPSYVADCPLADCLSISYLHQAGHAYIRSSDQLRLQEMEFKKGRSDPDTPGTSAENDSYRSIALMVPRLDVFIKMPRVHPDPRGTCRQGDVSLFNCGVD